MSEVKTAEVWGDTYETDVDGVIILELDDDIEMTIPYSDKRVPVTIVHGASESDILSGLSLLAKSREVCEHRWKYKSILDGDNYLTACGVAYPEKLKLDRPCWCGRKVSIKESPND